MNIYRLRNSLNLKEIGRYPQVEEAIYPIPVDDPDFSERLWYKKADLSRIVFPKPIIVKGAKLTDYISCSIMGTSARLLISTKLKEILEDSLHREMEFIPATIIVKGEENNDYWFTNHYNLSQDLIDFERSEIWKDGGATKKNLTGRVFIKNFEAYQQKEKEIKSPVGLSIKQLFLKATIHEEFFMLRWVQGGIGYYVNEDLKKRIEAAGCTGIRFMGVNEPI